MKLSSRLLFLSWMICASALGAAEKNFTFRLQGEPETLDWNRAHTPIETHLMVNLMEGLVSVDSTLKPQPALAKSWKISQDRKTYTFELRKNLKWSDGTPLTAQDFVTSWQRLLQPQTAAAYAYFLFDISGAEDFNRGKITDFSHVGIRALNALTLEVRLRTPIAHWIYIPSYWVTFPLRKDLLEKYGDYWTQPGKMVTCGPYVLSSYQLNAKIVLKPNPHYYAKPSQLDSVIGLIVADDNTALQLYQTGKLDFLTDFPVLDGKGMKSNPNFHAFPYLKTAYLGFGLAGSLKNNPMQNLHLRRAIAMGINRAPLGDLLQGGQTPGSSFVPPPMKGYAPNLGLAFNPEQAKAELKLSGISLTQPLELLLLNWEKSITVGQYLQQQLKTNLGIALTLTPFDNKTYRAQLDLHRYPLFLASWSADYPDADNFMSIFMSDSGNNRPGWHHPQYDERVLAARHRSPSPLRDQSYLALQKLLLEQEAVIVPLYYEPNIALVNPRVHGLKLNPLNYLDLRGVELFEQK